MFFSDTANYTIGVAHAQSSANVTAPSSANVTAPSSANVTAPSSANVTAPSNDTGLGIVDVVGELNIVTVGDMGCGQRLTKQLAIWYPGTLNWYCIWVICPTPIVQSVGWISWTQ